MPGPPEQVPTVHYQWTSDSVGNQITYIGKDGKQILKQVRFRPLPVGFARTVRVLDRFRVAKRQNIAARIQSPQIYATCSIKVNGKQVAYRRALTDGRGAVLNGMTPGIVC